MRITSTFGRGFIGLLGACVLSAAFAAPAFATDSPVTQEIRGGGLNASIAAASMTPVDYSNSPNQSTGVLHLSVSDQRGTSLGWNVTVVSTDFEYQGSSPSGLDIPNTGFAIITAHDPTQVSGQAINATGGPYAVGGGSLNTLRKTIAANAGFGSGDYDQDLDVQLAIPAQSQAGVYVATLSVIITSAP